MHHFWKVSRFTSYSLRRTNSSGFTEQRDAGLPARTYAQASGPKAEGWERRRRDVTGWFEQRAPAPLSMTYILPYCYSPLLEGKKKKNLLLWLKRTSSSRLFALKRTDGCTLGGWTDAAGPSHGILACAFCAIAPELLLLLLPLKSENALIAPGEPHLCLWPKWNTALPPSGAKAKLSGLIWAMGGGEKP